MSTSWEYSRQLVFDDNGNRCPGALAFFFEAGTLTPLPVYQDAALSVAHTHPVEADGSGRMPRVYLPTGTYRIRVTKVWTDPPNDTVPGVVLWDDDDVDGTPVQVVEGETVDETKIAATGDLKWKYGIGVLSGWVRCNGRSIGSSTSGASERANADCEALFEWLWNADSSLEVAGGRGSSAAADWAANKTIALPDTRSRLLVPLADMGNTAATLIGAGLFDSGDAETIGSPGGEDEHTLTEAELAVHDHETEEAGDHFHYQFTTNEDSSGSEANATDQVRRGWTPPSDNAYRMRADTDPATTGRTSVDGDHIHTVTEAGGGEAHNNMPPFLVGGTVYIRL